MIRPNAFRDRRRGAGLLSGALLGLLLAGCTQSRSASPAAEKNTPLPRLATATISGRWFAFSGGKAVSVEGPEAAKAGYLPWTIQTRAAGILSKGATVYVAVNGWGLLAFSLPAATDQTVPRFQYHERRGLFGERTINGFYSDAKQLTLNIYRNTVFNTPLPASNPVTYVRFDSSSDRLTPVVLPPTLDGWEPIEIVRDAEAGWAFTWKRVSGGKVSFRYSLYDPRGGELQSIDRTRFLAAYGFRDTAHAPAAVTAIADAARARQTTGAAVLHLLVRDSGNSRIERYRSGSQRELELGNATLTSIPVVRAKSGSFALLPGGRIVEPGGGGTKLDRLPILPAGYAYNDFWTDGNLIVVSWEQQRFTEVGSAGLFVATLPAK